MKRDGTDKHPEMDAHARQLPLIRLLRWVYSISPRRAWLFFGITLLQGLTPLLVVYSFKLVVDVVTEAIQRGNSSLDGIVMTVLFAAAAILLNTVMDSIGQSQRENYVHLLTDGILDQVHAKSISIDLSHYELSERRDALHRAQQASSHRPIAILNALAQSMLGMVTALGLLGVLMSLHLLAAFLLLAATIPLFFVRIAFSGRLFRWERSKTNLDRTARYFSWVMVSYRYAKELRLFGFGDHLRERFNELRREFRTEKASLLRKRALQETIYQGVGAVALVAALLYIIRLAVRGLLTLGDLVLYVGAFQRGTTALRQVFRGIATVYENTLFVGNLFEFLDLEAEHEERPARQGQWIPRNRDDRISTIELRNAAFSYPGMDQRTLLGVTMKLERGMHAAVVGRNGSGKSTLLKVLCGLYPLDEGELLVNGIPLKQYGLNRYRRGISAIFQDFAVYNMTGRESIGLGGVGHGPLSDVAVETAAKDALVHDILNHLPGGYETMLAKWYLDGIDLSYGQWQRLAIARALVREMDVLFMDEITSAQDTFALREIMDRIVERQADRIFLNISHQREVVARCDCVYVLDNRTIADWGDHETLLERNQLYREIRGL